MSDLWAEMRESLRSRACAHEEHGECPHFASMGAGLNPRRLRLEFGAGLCPCSCHSSCPATPAGKRMTVPFKVWRESCTCPGAHAERHRLDEAGLSDPPDFDELREEARRRSRARREAFEATRARSAGKSQEEIREMYVAELRARGLKVPGDPVLEAVADRITGNPLPAILLAGEGLARMGKALYDLSRHFR
jgi:hypothetical protein